MKSLYCVKIVLILLFLSVLTLQYGIEFLKTFGVQFLGFKAYPRLTEQRDRACFRHILDLAKTLKLYRSGVKTTHRNSPN